jgi:formylglycine-generating enzyme required for sulfatase activity
MPEPTDYPENLQVKDNRLLAASADSNRTSAHQKHSLVEKSMHLPRKRNRLGMEFVLIPGRSFVMGTSEKVQPRDTDEAQQIVDVTSFWLQTTPVTQKQYTTLMDINPSRIRDADLPVHGVTIFDALNFTAALKKEEHDSYRLPREYEWEYACSEGGRHRELCRDPQKLDQIAWYRNNAGGEPQPVGRKRPNAFGLHDLLGNVKELTRDIYAPEYDPLDKGLPHFLEELWPGSPVSVRGGNFNSPARHLRPAARAFVVAVDYCPNPGVGFRLAMDAE